MKEWSSEEIMDLRKDHKMTRRVLGELVGVTVTTVYQWERRLRNPSRTTKLLLSRVEDELRKKRKGR
jgi:DNA-binding transcriptional regulator YiaG